MSEPSQSSSRFPPIISKSSHNQNVKILPKSAGHERINKRLIDRPVKSATFEYSWQQRDESIFEEKRKELEKNTNLDQTEVLSQCSEDYIDCFDTIQELQTLRNENTKLKHNFVKLGNIIKKCQKQLTHKDTIIIKLQKQHDIQDVVGVEESSDNDKIRNSLKKCALMIESSEIKDEPTLKQLKRLIRAIVNKYWEDCVEAKNLIQDNDHESVEARLNAIYNSMSSTSQEILEVNKLDCDNILNGINERIQEFTEEKCSMKEKIDLLTKKKKQYDDEIYDFAQSMLQVEMQLQLLGREPKVLEKELSKLVYALNSSPVGEPSLDNLKKLIIQSYNNQLKWVEGILNKSEHEIYESADEDELETVVLNNKEKLESDSSMEDNDNNVHNEEVQTLSDDNLNFPEEIDVESINNILMIKALHLGSTFRNLEVVTEEDEECENGDEDEDETSEVTTISFNYNGNEDENVIKEMLDEMVIAIDKEIDASERDSTKKDQKVVRKLSAEVISSNNNLIQKSPNHDSAFTSDDNCSSPEIASNNHVPFTLFKEDGNNNTKNTNAENTLDMIKRNEEVLVLKNDLISATDRIVKLEQMVDSNDKCVKQSEQHYKDEISAWREMVEQQNALLEKMRIELEETQKNLRDKEMQERKESVVEIEDLESQKSFEEHEDECGCDDEIKEEVKQVSEENDNNSDVIEEDEENNSLFNLFEESSLDNEWKEELPKEKSDEEEKTQEKSKKIRFEDERNVITEEQEEKESRISSRNSNYHVKSDASDNNDNESSQLSDFSDEVPIPEYVYQSNHYMSPTQEEASKKLMQERFYYGFNPRKRILPLKKIEIVFPSKDTRRRVAVRMKK